MKEEILASAAQWLRYDRRCMLIATERCYWDCTWMRPDIFAVTLNRKAIEIEIKLTEADFLNNFKKKAHTYRGHLGHCYPHYYYFFVPPDLVSSVKDSLPQYAGLLTLDDSYSYGIRQVKVIKSSPLWKEARDAKVRDVARMAQHMSGTLTRLFAARVKAPAPQETLFSAV